MVHHSAADGYQERARTYERARPSYHPELIDRFVAGYADGLVVELGAGTGIFTRQLVEAGVEPIAVEPVAAMRQRLVDALPHIDARDGSAEAIPVESGSADTVVAAQAFHWFEHERALGEIYRVLRPGGHLVTVWNVRDEAIPWMQAYTNIVGRFAADTPRYHTMVWRDAIDADPRFDPTSEWHVANPTATTPQGVVDRVLSTSFMAVLDPAEQGKVAGEIRELVEDLGAKFEFPYRSEFQTWCASGEHN